MFPLYFLVKQDYTFPRAALFSSIFIHIPRKKNAENTVDIDPFIWYIIYYIMQITNCSTTREVSHGRS